MCQRFYFHNNRTISFHSYRECRSDIRCCTEEGFGWIFEVLETCFCHFKKPNRIRGSKTIFHRTEDTIGLVFIPLKKENGVDEMFECLWSSEITIFRNMAYQYHSSIRAFAVVHACLSNHTNLRSASCRTSERFGVEYAHRIDNDDRVCLGFERADNIFEHFLVEKMNMGIIYPQSMSSACNLFFTFFSGDVEHWCIITRTPMSEFEGQC